MPKATGPILSFLLFRNGSDIVFSILEQDMNVIKRGDFAVNLPCGYRVASSGSPELERSTIYLRGSDDRWDTKICHLSLRSESDAISLEQGILKALVELGKMIGSSSKEGTSLVTGPFYTV